MLQDTAETIALQALTYILGSPEHLSRFIALTGYSSDDLRAAATSPEALGGVLDFVLSDERLLLDCADACQLKPEDLPRARNTLPGAPTQWI